jgi:predicted MPP superfamily phosphohydrolase
VALALKIRAVWGWFLAWAALTALGTMLHHWLWTGQSAGSGTLQTTPLVQSIGNLVHMLIGPAWVLLRIMSRSWPTGSWVGPLVANAIGWLCWIAAIWIGLMIRAWLSGLRAGEPVARVVGPQDSSRRRFLIDAPCAVAAVCGAAALAKGEFSDPWNLTLRRYRVPIRDLPFSLDGLRAVQLSDTHLGPRIPAAYIREVVERTLALKPDLVLLTGDYIHNGTAFIDPAAALFKPITRAGIPTVGVLGNHDWYGDGHAMSRALSAIGVSMVDNRRAYLNARRRVVPDAPGDPALCIAGLGDLGTDWVDAARALGNLAPSMPRIVLAHNPDTSEIVAGRARYRRYGRSRGFVPAPIADGRIDLMLSGHTHGGQVWVPFLGTPIVPSRFGQRYAGGLVPGPGFPVLVSRGVGMSILPVRLGVPPEIVEVTLVRA